MTKGGEGWPWRGGRGGVAVEGWPIRRSALRERWIRSKRFAHGLVGEGDFQEGGAEGVVSQFFVERNGWFAGVKFDLGDLAGAGELFGELHESPAETLAAVRFGDGHLAKMELIWITRDGGENEAGHEEGWIVAGFFFGDEVEVVLLCGELIRGEGETEGFAEDGVAEGDGAVVGGASVGDLVEGPGGGEVRPEATLTFAGEWGISSERAANLRGARSLRV
jgi:hypothetical protein